MVPTDASTAFLDLLKGYEPKYCEECMAARANGQVVIPMIIPKIGEMDVGDRKVPAIVWEHEVLGVVHWRDEIPVPGAMSAVKRDKEVPHVV